jgi:PKD repeat protein
MKTRIFTTAMILLLSLTLMAEHVEISSAANVGKNFYWEKCGNTLQTTYEKTNVILQTTRTMNGIPVYYVFNVNAGNGYVVVAADDNVTPVLGYSATGQWSGENMPPALQQMLNWYAAQIDYAIAESIDGGKAIETLWEKYEKPVAPACGAKSVSPLLSTTWNQNIWYNEQCPVDPAGPGGHAYAGCVAVSMAQVMKYWQHPAQGIGSNSYSHPVYGVISANFSAATYTYASMPNSISSSNTHIAQLMFHCGVSVDMNYGPSGSAPMGALWDQDIENALKNNFDYSSTLQWQWKKDYSNSTWVLMLKAELDAGRPLIYYGWDGANMAHNFNCDGYDTDYNFHFNWGWGGSYDGYFSVQSLIPVQGYDFTYYQGAIFNMYPNQNPPQSGYDWGDAPDNPGYPTLAANNGARHAVPDNPTLYLGYMIDTETDGQPHINCVGDDNSGLADEDGVVFPALFIGQNVSLTVIATGSGLLDAWMDFNQDADWADAGEQIFANKLLVNGTNYLTLTIPATANTGWTYARFRYSSQGSLSYTGDAEDGEVEDYFVRIINDEQPEPEYEFLFSLDIGSDSEMSDKKMDGNEVFDPGDAYLFQGAFIPPPGANGFLDDPFIFGYDPMPVGGMPGTAAPVLSGLPVDQVQMEYFDMDGLVVANCDLRDFEFGEGLPPIPQFNDPDIHFPQNLMISFSDDDGFPYTHSSGSVPSLGFSSSGQLHGQQPIKDETLQVAMNLTAPVPIPVQSVAPLHEESAIHINMAPDPDFTHVFPNEKDDDVDALAAVVSFTDLQYYFFTADHEATGMSVSGFPLNPGSIYVADAGTPVEVVNAQYHLGLPEGTDVDAFTFSWINDPQFGYVAFAIIFSVDEDDPTTPFDESGGLMPNMLYYSFLNGFSMIFSTEMFEDNIDALTVIPALQQGPKADFTPLNSTIQSGQIIQFTDLSTGGPTSWSWNFAGGNPASFNGQTPPPVAWNTPGNYSVSLTVSNALGSDTKSGTVQVTPANWQFTPTNLSHLISVPVSANPTINGTPLAAGDLLGVFYTDNGGNKCCGGFAAWDGVNNIAVMAYGDDVTTTQKDGFINGEQLTWKALSCVNMSEHNLYVTYDQTMPNTDGKYQDSGISALTAINTWLTHSIAVNKGWNGISSYLEPVNTNLDTLLAPILGQLVILQNFAGAYWPAAGLNNLYNWDVYSGYNIKVTQDVVLNIHGTLPANRTLNLAPGWHIIPVLSSSGVAAASVLGDPGIMVAKEIAGGKVYWPGMNIFTLTHLFPGKAYCVYVTSAASISYPAKSAIQIEEKPEVELTSPWPAVKPTPVSHLVVIPQSATAHFEKGDFIGAFTETGINAGSIFVSGDDLVLTIYGDDPTTATVDGMTSGGKITYKHFDSRTGATTILDPVFGETMPDDGNYFIVNGLSVMDLKTGAESNITSCDFRIYPNPAQNFVTVEPDELLTGLVRVELVGMMGEIVKSESFGNHQRMVINLNNVAGGVYILQISNNEKTISQKLIVRK